MSWEQREHLSSLSDDELGPSTQDLTLGALLRDEELRSLWARYHVIGEALRGEPVSRQAFAIADRVHRQLAAEPEKRPARSWSWTQAPRWLIHAGGFALAASVLLLAVLSGPAWFGDPATPTVQVVQRMSPVPGRYQDPSSRWGVHQPEVALKLDRFLVNHQRASPVASLKGMVPYVTFVDHGR
jgi:sigma-E factor negative regulatory protein RseA